MDRRTFLGGLAASVVVAERLGWAEEGFRIAWGEPRDGFQTGLSLALPKTEYAVGERIGFQLHIKNVGSQAETLPLRSTRQWSAILNSDGLLQLHPIQEATAPLTLKAGEAQLAPGDGGTFLLQPWNGAGKAEEPLIRLAPGEYRSECSLGLWLTDLNDPNRATALKARPGTLSFRVRAEGQPALPKGDPPAGEPGIAWGKPVNGIQLGVRFRDGRSRFRVGDEVVVELRARNVVDQELRFAAQHSQTGWPGSLPSITNEKGEHQRLRFVFFTGFRPLTEFTLKPEETTVLGYPTFTVEAADDASDPTAVPKLAAAPGKYRLKQYESGRPDGATFFHLLLESGALEFEIVPS